MSADVGGAAPAPAPGFSHSDTGTGEPAWLLDDRWDEVPTRRPEHLATDHRRVVLVAAHPDDEVLGAGATVADLADLGLEVRVVIATDGERSHPEATAWRPEALARARRAEAARAVEVLAPGASVHFLGLPDGALTRHTNALTSALASHHLGSDTLVLAPWTADGHPDHDAAGAAACAAAASAGSTVLHYPIWLWHWGHPDLLPWAGAVLVTPTREGLVRKHAAIEQHASQTGPLGPGLGDAAVLGAHVLRRFTRVVEVLLPPAGADAPRPGHDLTEGHADAPDRDGADRAANERATRFDAMFDDGDDPWGFTTSWYEERKRDLTMAVLGRRRYRRALDVGCSTGLLTRALAGRAEQVTGLDHSSRALAVARSASAAPGDGRVTWLRARVPNGIPTGAADLVVLSEIGYFLDGAELLATLRRARAALAPGGEIVLVHWQAESTGIPLDGRLVHEQAEAALDLPLRVRYADADVRIDVYGDGPSIGVEEGLR